MRALALALIVAVPSAAFAQQKATLLDPAFEQSVTADPALALTPVYQRVGLWLGLSAATVLVVSLVVFAVFSAMSHPTPPATQSSFSCSPRCDGWINKPAM